MNLCIFASDLSVVTGHNKWHSTDEIVLKIWRRNFPDDFERIKNMWEKEKNKSADTIFLTAEEYIHKTAKKNNIDIDNLMNECHQSQTVGQLGSRKKSDERNRKVIPFQSRKKNS